MTPDTTRSVDRSHTRHGSSDLDVLIGLWEEARFPRLPCDAPNELRDLVEDVDNPKRVHVIHKASRRHNFQSIVQKYIIQLRDGCDDESCAKPTCFTFRKQNIGRAPIRRYNTTSARTLAIYLATQDNPEHGLCSAPRPPKAPPATANSLLFLASPRDTRSSSGPAKGPSRGSGHKGNGSALETVPLKPRSGGDAPDKKSASGGTGKPTGASENTQEPRESRDPGFVVVEKPVSTDYRSFAANVFGTVAFKMMEWLTPAAIEEMTRKASLVKKESGASDIRVGGRAAQEDRGGRGPESDATASGKKPSREKPSVPASTPTDLPKSLDQTDQGASDNGEKSAKSVSTPKDDRQPTSLPPPAPQRRNSNAKVRTSSGPRTKRQLSVDSFAPDPSADDPFTGLLRSPRANGGSADKISRSIKTPSSALPRPISQISSALDGVPLETMPPPKSLDTKPKLGRSQLDGARGSESASPKDAVGSGASSDRSCSTSSTHAADDDSEPGEDDVYPQTLSRLDPDVVDFMCNTIQQDGTAERHLLEPQTVTRFHNKDRQKRTLRRKTRTETAKMPNLTLEWKMFVDQTLFYVLSDPRLALESFTSQGLFYDSHTLWYCMLRMTRIAPSLVFDALWMAAGSLFAPPKSLRSSGMPKAKLFSQREESLSNKEAGRLISICLHALVAAAPLVDDPRQLYDMSRIRSHGLILAGSGAVAQQPSELCLQYEDAFADDMALRLARRVFAALSARNLFDRLIDVNSSSGEPTSERSGEQAQHVLAPLFSQLDFFSAESAYKLEFSVKERGLHERRIPILLLDWARTVMIQDWNGTPEILAEGAFGGALALIDAMYEKRHELLLGDVQFRSEYFADRLDMVQVPISWLTRTSTWRNLHLLDFPYLFSPSTIVSYFRAINFSRMSRAYEEASSYQEKIEVISHRFNFRTHHREVLAERLAVATSKYLILDIRREEVLQDAFDQLWRREERELTKPFKVHLGGSLGENGSDLGGVSQEFFRIAIAQALNPDFGAFAVDERTRMTWFVPGSVEPEWKFELVGLLVSLALYNGLTLPVTFPRALYRKLLGEPVCNLHHIEDGWGPLAAGLTTLLEWDEKDGLVEDVFARTYEFSVEVYGQHVTREMRPPPLDDWPQFPDISWASTSNPAPHEGNPGGDDEAPMVTNANRHAYVADYVTWLTDVSVRRQYQAFERGFLRCLHAKSLWLLTPAILQSMVEGVQEIDLGELQRYTRYEGWDASHRSVKDFWSIVMGYDDEQKRKLLEFVTASDRVPVGGAKNIMFVLQRHGEESEPNGRLPTSYTCFGTLLMPEYKSREMMREKMAMALENSQGFGFA